MTSLPPYPTLIPPPPYPQYPPPQHVHFTPSLPPPSLPTCHPYNPYHPPLPFFTPPQFFWPTFGQGPPPPPLPIASHTVNVSHPSTLQPKPTVSPTQPSNVSLPSTFQPKPTVTPAQPPKPQQPKPKPQSGGVERISAVFRIDSKVFSLAFDGGRIDSYAIHERRGKFHGAIRVGRLGLDWIIACLTDLDQWNFRKQPFFKRLRENSKLLEVASRFNKSGLFVEISEYHNGARRGCLRVPEGTKISGWTLFGRRLSDYFLGKKIAGPVERVVAGGGEFEKAVDLQKPPVWKKLNGLENKGSNLRVVKHLPNITGQHNQFESLGGFDEVSIKTISASVSTAGRPVRVSHLKWTQAHFCLKISIDLVGEGKRTVSWGKLQPIASRPNQAHQTNRENGLGQPSFDISSHTRRSVGSDDLQISGWVTGEGSGTHEDEKGEIPSSGEGLGGIHVADMKSVEEPAHMEESGEFQCSGERLSDPIVTDSKLIDRESGSVVHGTVVEADLSVARAPACSPVVGDQNVDQGTGFLVADTGLGARETTVENSGCPVQVQSQVRVVSDLNVPISEVGCGSVDPEVSRLIWDASLPLGKGEEAVNPEVITPLALWDPNGSLDLVSMDDGSDGISVEEVLEPSEWVSRMIRDFGTYVGFPIDCCEKQCIDFFQKLERVWEQQATAVTTRRVSNSNQKGMRELRNLFSSINYDGHSGRSSRGSLKPSSLGLFVGK